jgi:hypothetical protein
LVKPREGLKVVSGLVRFYNSVGLSLQDILQYCVDNGYQPSWVDFYIEATQVGWTEKTIFSRLREAITDVYGVSYWTEVEKRFEELKKLCANENTNER